MNTFTLRLYDPQQTREFEKLVTFSGRDESGSFGILANHARLMSVLSMGLAWFRLADGDKFYLACPGGVLYFDDNILSISTRHYIVDSDHQRVQQRLQEDIKSETSTIERLKDNLQRMEEGMLRRLWNMERRQ